MTEIEFANQAQRALIAFGLELDAPAERVAFPFDTGAVEYAVEFEAPNLTVLFWHHSPFDKWGLQIIDSDNKSLCYTRWDSAVEVDCDGNFKQSAMVFSRALYCLGFDIALVETELNLSITAHEKLEWQLEFQRRLREETSQAE